MKSEKNKLVTQTPEQLSPGLCDPRSWKVNPPDTNKDYPFDGQRGDSKAECDALLAVRERGRKREKSNIEVRSVLERKHESFPSTDGKKR